LLGPIYDSCDNGDTVSQPAAGRTRRVAAGATGGTRFFSGRAKISPTEMSQPTNTLARDAIVELCGIDGRFDRIDDGGIVVLGLADERRKRPPPHQRRRKRTH